MELGGNENGQNMVGIYYISEKSILKKYLRRDPYDNQTGEVEYNDAFIPRNHYEMNLEIIKINEE